MHPNFHRSIRMAMTLAVVTAGSAATAQTWPAQPIRLVVPFAAGGSTDIVARALAARLSDRLGQSVVVENLTGAGGTIGAAAVAKAKPDGHTLLLGTTATQSIGYSVYPSLTYAPKDFAPVSLVATIPLVLTVHPSIAATSVAEFVAHARAKPGSISFASSGNGAITHLSAELFRLMTGTDMTHVPYRGSSQAVVDLVGGRVQMMIDHLPTVLPHIESGKLKALAVGEGQRIERLPKLPTIDESGVKGYAVLSWFGLLAPGGTPAPIVERLNSEVAGILASPEIRSSFAEQGAQARHTTAAQFQSLIERDIGQWSDVVRRANVVMK